MPTVHQIGNYTEVVEADNGDTIVRNTRSGLDFRVTDTGVEVGSLMADAIEALSIDADDLTSGGNQVYHSGNLSPATDSELESHRQNATHGSVQPADPASLDGTSLGQTTPLASLATEEAYYTPDRQPLSTTSNLAIYVDPTGSDSAAGTETDPVATVQEAIDRVPTFLRHPVEIHLAAGTYDEDVMVRGIFAHHDQFVGTNDDTGHIALQISGDTTTPSNVQLGSFYAVGCYGSSVPMLRGVELQRETPYSEEGGAVQFHQCSNPSIYACTWADAGITKGVLSYGGNCNINACDFGNGILNNAFQQKDVGITHVRNQCTGTVTGSTYLSTHGGHVSIREEVDISGGSSPIQDHGSLAVDAGEGTVRGIDILSTPRATSQRVVENLSVEVIRGLQRLNIPSGATSARLETITGDAPEGSRVVFYGTWDGPITVGDGDGNIWLANGEHILDGEFDTLELINRDGDNWIELSRTSR